MKQTKTNLRRPFSHLRQQDFKGCTRQTGWTMWSMMFVMSVVFVAAYIIMQLIPLYSANENIKNAMSVSLENKDMTKITRAQIIKGMQNQLYLDGATGLIDFKNGFSVKKSKGVVTASASYEREVPLVANLVLVAKFTPTAECERNGRCEIK